MKLSEGQGGNVVAGKNKKSKSSENSNKKANADNTELNLCSHRKAGSRCKCVCALASHECVCEARGPPVQLCWSHLAFGWPAFNLKRGRLKSPV